MTDILLTMLKLSLSGSLLAGLLFILNLLLKDKVSKSFSYYIWLLVLIRLVLPFGYIINLSRFSTSITGSEPSIIINDTNVYQNSNINLNTNINQTVSQSVMPPSNSKNIDNPSIDYNYNTNKLPSVNEPSADITHSLDLLSLLTNNLTNLWLTGMILYLCVHIISYIIFIHRICRSCETPHIDDITIFNQMYSGKQIRFVYNDYIRTPMLIGIFKPMIILPKLAFTSNGLEADLRNILCHELMHYHRHDMIYKWFVVITGSVHWFNPIIYLISKAINHACELSCDEAVIRNMNASQRQSYGNTLLTLAAKKHPPFGVTATTMCEEKRQLKGRLIHIMNYKKKSHWAIVLMFILTVLLTGCASVLAEYSNDSKDNGTISSNTQLPVSDGAPTPSITPSDPSLSDVYKSVLQSNIEFFNTDDHKSIYLDQFNVSSADVPMKITEFSIVDLDNDSMQEVVLRITVNDVVDYGSLVLSCQDGVVYGYTLWLRAFMELKTDGTFSYSSGAADHGFGTISFSKESYTIDRVTYNESNFDADNNLNISYTVSHVYASEDQFNLAFDRQSKKADIIWYEFTNDNIDSVLSEEYQLSEAADSWMEAYAGILSDAPAWPADRGYFGNFTLADVNFDGIPELFFLEGYRRPHVKCGYYYTNGKAVEMNLPESMPMGLELYRNNQTNEFLWLAGGTEYSSASKAFGDSGYQKYHQWWLLDFNNLSVIQKDLYLAWVVRQVWYASDTVDAIDKGFRYWLYKDEQTLWAWDADIGDLDEHYEVRLTALEAEQDAYFGMFELESKALYRDFYDFFTSDYNLNKTLLWECFADWDNRDAIPDISAWNGYDAEDGWGDDIEHINIWWNNYVPDELEELTSGDYKYVINQNNTATITKYIGKGRDVIIPSVIDGKKVTSIGNTFGETGAFQECTALTSVVIPYGVTEIQDNAFQSCTNLTSATIPASVNLLRNCAFDNCQNLKSIYFEGNAPHIGSYVFSSTSDALTLYYHEDMTGWTNPWHGITTGIY